MLRMDFFMLTHFNVYILVPDDFRTEEELSQDLVRMLLKSIYGTPDAPRIWYSVLSTHSNRLGLVQSEVDPCLFLSEDMQVWIIIYVDENVFGNKHSTFTRIKITCMNPTYIHQ